MKTTKIYLTRHAQSIHNLSDTYNSNPENDKGLSSNGFKQAKQLAKRLEKEKIDIIYSSNMPRCIQTAVEIAKVIRKKIIVNSKFIEPDMGKYELMKQTQIERKYPKIAKMWFGDGAENLTLGESFKTAQKRMLKEVDILAKKHKGKSILIITHQAPVKFVVCNLLGGLKYFNVFGIDNASLTLLEKNNKDYKLKYLNNISYLS
ncbi:MAG: histidine phosphatase family protein [Nanoarchaeota archaeon]|nr:histidine phosphatase family protein [Nanoarchaeota archaeon]